MLFRFRQDTLSILTTCSALRQPQSRFLATTLPHKESKMARTQHYYVLFTSDEYVWCYSENELVGEQDTRWS